MIKVGDRILCKKTYNYPLLPDVFIKGKRYIVERIEGDSIYIEGFEFFFVEKFKEDNSFLMWSFSECVYDYFYTIEEERKIKLEKII